MTRGHPPDWSARLLVVLAIVSFALGTWGFRAHLNEVGYTVWLDAAYRSLQLFFMNFEHPDQNYVDVEPSLQFARFLAFTTTVWVIVKAFFPQFRRWTRRQLRRQGGNCVLVLGYGPIGQAIGQALRQQSQVSWRITAVHPLLTPDLVARAWLDGVLLIEGDPSDPRVLHHVFAHRAERIYISDLDDLRAVDTSLAVRQHSRDPKQDIRLVLHDSAAVRQMAEAAEVGFLGAPGLRWFSLAEETAQQLIAAARFDRVAVETGSRRLHLAILGCGSQGEAIAVETLLTGWRIALDAPQISFIDSDSEGIEARMRRRMPAWFVRPEGVALHEAARPKFDFLHSDLENLDVVGDIGLQGLRSGVTGWVLATGNDALNLRAALALHRAIATRRIDPAPIYVRIPSGHSDQSAELVQQPLAMARTFGAIDEVISRSPLLDPDPDAVPKKLHALYAQTSVDMGLSNVALDWTDLNESRRNANRALSRHAAMKLEDFGVPSPSDPGVLPALNRNLVQSLFKVDAALDYARVDSSNRVEGWLQPGKILTAEEAGIARLLRDAAICEHNRWTIERALEHYTATERSDPVLRDDIRRLHDSMHSWYELRDADVRRHDIVLLRGLLAGSELGRTETSQHHRAERICLPIQPDGQIADPYFSMAGESDPADVTELRISLFFSQEPGDPRPIVGTALKVLNSKLGSEGCVPLRRLRFDFHRPYGPRAFMAANLLVEDLRIRHRPNVLIEPHWAWKAENGPVIGFVGHRDLTGFSSEAALSDRLRKTFMALVAEHRAEALICGYAPGADQISVKVWASLGLQRPRLVFPFKKDNGKNGPIYCTIDPVQATPDTAYAEDGLRQIGWPTLPDHGTGHLAQAETVLSQADILVAVLDDSREVLSGGTKDTVNKARAMGREVVVINPDSV